jgi:hypothetical protein
VDTNAPTSPAPSLTSIVKVAVDTANAAAAAVAVRADVVDDRAAAAVVVDLGAVAVAAAGGNFRCYRPQE